LGLSCYLEGMGNLIIRCMAMENQIVTDADIQALVDNQLSWEDAQRVANYLATHAAARQRYHDLLEQNRLIAEWWRRKKTQQN